MASSSLAPRHQGDNTPAMRVEKLTVSYDGKPVLRDVSLSLDRGQIVGVIGPNGAGKSTLLKAALGLIPSDSGEVSFFGQPLREARSRIAYVPQREAVDWDYPVNVMDVVLMGRYGHIGWLRRPSRDDEHRALAALDKLGMADFARRQIGQLSGGQQQRVFLARALVQEADLLFLDEPFIGVDAATESAIYLLMKELRDEDKTVVVVNHDLAAASRECDSLVLLNGELVSYGPSRDVFTPHNLQRAYGGRLATFDADGSKVMVMT